MYPRPSILTRLALRRVQNYRSGINNGRCKCCSSRALVIPPKLLQKRFYSKPPNHVSFCFSDLTNQNKTHLLDADPKKYLNFALRWMLKSQPQLQTLEFILSNYHELETSLLTTFSYDLLQSGNIKAAISLQHFLLDKCPKYQIPNQLWSYLIDQVCAKSDHVGAMFIYHELIDNHKFYAELNFGVQENDFIPFLVCDSVLVRLATIFANNEDHLRILGLLRYFRRFYSYLHHRDNYRAMLLLLIESHAKLGNLKPALDSFRRLALITKDYQPYNEALLNNSQPVEKVQEEEIRWRDANIEANEYKYEFEPKENFDIHQNLLCQLCQTEKYTPLIHRNVYSFAKTQSGGIAHNPILSSAIAITDLPEFINLLASHFLSSNDTLQNISTRAVLEFIMQCHIGVSAFVISALCKVGNTKQAFLVMQALMNKTSKRNASRNQNFVTILDSISARSAADHQFADEVYNYHKLIKRGYVNKRVLQLFVRFLLTSPFTTSSDLLSKLEKLKTWKEARIFVSKDMFAAYENLDPSGKFHDLIICNEQI